MKLAAINLDSTFAAYVGPDGAPLQQISPLSRVNLFVGANNVGKSRLLRGLASSKKMFGVSASTLPKLKELNKALSALRDVFAKHGIYSMNGVAGHAIDLPSTVGCTDDGQGIALFLNSILSAATAVMYREATGEPIRDTAVVASAEKAICAAAAEAKTQLQALPAALPPMKRVYIPTLRGVHGALPVDSDPYADQVRQMYFSKIDAKDLPFAIYTGHRLWTELHDMSHQTQATEDLKRDYETFISQHFFESRPVRLIAVNNPKVVRVSVKGEGEHALHDLGQGIEEAIVLTFHAFTHPEPILYFIEEPEVHLHPGFQRAIIELYCQSTAPHQFFIATHSNHLMDMSLDYSEIQVFSCMRVPADARSGRPSSCAVSTVTQGDRSTLELLGVRNSSVFLVNTTIWVEGITDRLYLRHMLRLYQDRLQERGELPVRMVEDIHFAFVEYGGANITHWSFLDQEEHPVDVDRLCGRLILVVDKDGAAKLARKTRLREKLGERFLILPGREIENCLPPSAIAAVVSDYEGDVLDASAFPQEDYLEPYLGSYLERRVKELRGNRGRKGSYVNASANQDAGTVSAKRAFCEKACAALNYSELHQDVQAIVERIYRFIASAGLGATSREVPRGD